MTGIDIETIESKGQSLETIQSDIVDFFSPDTVLIGQNISFDIGFLKKFFP
jgi:DNA polymerase III epsilon subunit-like protein